VIGATVADRFTADVNLLISAEGNDATSSKAVKAKEKGIEVWSEMTFQELLKS
jgi:NAD-dependent DNA ligase